MAQLTKITAFVLLGICLMSCVSCSNSTKSQPYVYPIRPGMEAWNKLNSLEEKIEACKIPEDILKSMTTPDLVETVAAYPLACNILAYATPSKDSTEPVEKVRKYFNGLQELSNRNDALPSLKDYLDKANQNKKADNNNTEQKRIKEDDSSIRISFVEGIIKLLEKEKK